MGANIWGVNSEAGAGQLDLQMDPQPRSGRGDQGETPARLMGLSSQCKLGNQGWVGVPCTGPPALPSPTPTPHHQGQGQSWSQGQGKGLLLLASGIPQPSSPSSPDAPQLPGGCPCSVH